MRKIKVKRACNINGSAWKLKRGQVLEEAEAGAWIVDHLLNLGFAAEVKPRRKKDEQGEHYG